MLRAVSSADSVRINARRTIDSQDPPEISLLVEKASQPTQVNFTGNAWTAPVSSIVVFDSEFVELNVYSGFEIRADQRQSLLEFALGDQAVLLKKKVEQLTIDIEIQTRRRGEAERTISGYASPLGLTEFMSLQPVSDAKSQIDALHKRIEAAKSVQQLLSRKEPVGLPPIRFDLGETFATLAKELEDVEESAEALVRKHFAKHGGLGLEEWVSHGQRYLVLDECPFCGQSLSGLDLIRAYRSYFNEAYSRLKSEVASLEQKIASALSESKVEAFEGAVATNNARIEAWRDQLELTVPMLAANKIRIILDRVRQALLALASKKRQNPLEAVGSESQLQELTADLDAANEVIASYNASVDAQVEKIETFKKSLAGEDVSKLESAVRKLEAAQKRQLPKVVDAVSEYQAADAERKRLEEAKNFAREQADKLIESTLQQYQATINSLLTSFGAEFSIEQLKPTYVGSGEPRAEYGLSVRNKLIKLGGRSDVPKTPCFGNTLGDGDKRTLAFAFFIARLRTDPGLNDKIVVLDDPVSSLDSNRRHRTLKLICDLATKCRQVIVLSHNPYFVRELREQLCGMKPVPLTLRILGIRRVQKGYSAFAPCDIDDVCSSDYYRHHSLVSDYVDGKSQADVRDVAKAIRPLLEGYYHRRFPRRIPRQMLLGQVISEAGKAAPADPLSNLKPLIKELSEINEYAGKFHHDADSAFDPAPPNDTELLQFARRALNLIYQNG